MQSHYLKTHLSRNFREKFEWMGSKYVSKLLHISFFIFPSLLCVNSAHCWGGLVPSEYFFIIMSLSPRLKNFLWLKSNLGQRLCHKKGKKKNSKPQGCFLVTRFVYCFSDFSSLTYLLRVIFSSCGILLLGIVLITLDINSWPKPHN